MDGPAFRSFGPLFLALPPSRSPRAPKNCELPPSSRNGRVEEHACILPRAPPTIIHHARRQRSRSAGLHHRLLFSPEEIRLVWEEWRRTWGAGRARAGWRGRQAGGRWIAATRTTSAPAAAAGPVTSADAMADQRAASVVLLHEGARPPSPASGRLRASSTRRTAR